MLSLLICPNFDLKCFEFPLKFVFSLSLSLSLSFPGMCFPLVSVSLFLLPVHLSPTLPLLHSLCSLASQFIAFFFVFTMACAHVSCVSRFLFLFLFFLSLSLSISLKMANIFIILKKALAPSLEFICCRAFTAQRLPKSGRAYPKDSFEAFFCWNNLARLNITSEAKTNLWDAN